MDDQATSQASESLKSQIHLEQIRLLYDGLLFSLLASFVIALIIFFTLLDKVDSRGNLDIWLYSMLSLLLIRGGIAYLFSNSPPKSHLNKKWSTYFLTGTFLGGTLWGTLPWLGHSAHDEYQALIVICIVGVVAGSLSTLSYRWKAITLFMMPATLLLEANLLIADGKFSNVTSFVLGIFILFSLIAAKRINNNTQQNIRLRIEAANREHAIELMHQKQVLHVQQTPLAVIEFDINLHVKEWNKAAEEIFGYHRSEAINKNILKLIVPEKSRSEVEKLQHNLLDFNSIIGHVIENRKKDGGHIFCEWYITPLTKNDDEIVCIAAMALDITDKKRVEEDLVAAKNESERASQAKSIFLSNVSHEIRTPLNAIIGFTQLLSLDTKSVENQASRIGEINDASQLLLNLVNQILDFSKIEEGKLTISNEIISMQEIIIPCISLVTPLAKEKQVDLKIETAISGQIRADHTRIKQVILNLLTNAIKYNHKGGYVYIRCSEVSRNKVRIEIEDTGTGIPEDKQAQLFQPFNRLGIETKKIEGIGIGLSIAKQLIEMMGGNINYSSRDGAGSSFWIELEGNMRAIALPQPEKHEIFNIRENVSTSPSNTRVLVAEDNPTNQKLIISQLNTLGYKTDLACDGGEALKLFSTNNYSLVLTDCNMPIMDGYELTQTIRNSGNHHTPIIAITADAFPEREKQCTSSGMNGRIIKPFTLDKLSAVMDKWLEHAS